MEFWLYLLLFYMPNIVETARDPMTGYLTPDVSLRNLDCEPISTEGARRLAPGRVSEPAARGDFLNRRAVICRERLMPMGVRRPQDDALLSNLRGLAADMAGAVAEAAPTARDRTWLVEVFHPDAALSYKISFAVKNALMARGVRVTDRAPSLAAGDVEVLGLTPQNKAYPLACARYVAGGALGPDDALLAVVLRDPRETIMHAGVCVDGRWRWVR